MTDGFPLAFEQKATLAFNLEHETLNSPAAPTVTHQEHVGWRWKHKDADQWIYKDGIEKPNPGLTPIYESGVTYEKVYTNVEKPPVAWWYSDSTGCFHMSLDLDLGLRHERENGVKVNWMSSAVTSGFFDDINDINRMAKLRKLCGYVENGTSTSVTISQDDATKDWLLHVKSRGKTVDWWHAKSLRGVIDAAVAAEDRDEIALGSDAEDELVAIGRKIAEFRRQMTFSEMGNDSYYTDGSRQSDLEHLQALERERTLVLAKKLK